MAEAKVPNHPPCNCRDDSVGDEKDCVRFVGERARGDRERGGREALVRRPDPSTQMLVSLSRT